MRHNSGVSSSLVLLLIVCVAAEIHGCGSTSGSVLQRLQLMAQAATEQLNARRSAEHALVEAENRIAHLDQALQQGARPATSIGQVVDTRVLGRPDKWDGSEQCSAWLAHGGVADALSSVFPENNARLVVMMQEMLAFPFDTNDVGRSRISRDTQTSRFRSSSRVAS